MKISNPRFKAVIVSTGFSFWFFILTSIFGFLSLEIFSVFVIVVFVVMQFLATKVAKALDYFAILNTKVFLGILYVFVISIYGILFKLLRIDLLRTKKQSNTYWLKMEELKSNRIFNQY